MKELAPATGWIDVGTPRMVAPPRSQWGFMLRLVSRWARRLGRPEIPDVITVLHLNPRLFWPWLVFASRMMPGGRLPARLRELLILRTGWNCRCRYEWGQHVDIGLRVGLTDAEIRKVTQGPSAFAGSDDHAALLACDEICATQCISAPTWERLRTRFSEKLLLELMLLVGHYIMVAAFLNSAGLKLEPPIESRLQAFHGRLAAAA